MANFTGQDFSGSPNPYVSFAAATAGPATTVYSFTGGGGTATVLKYLMRGKRSGAFEYWYATSVDSGGSENPGGSAGLSDIVWIKNNTV
jgi:hypothetical protein